MALNGSFPAQMAVAVGPIRAERQQAPIGGSCLSVTFAIAEHPGADVQHLGIVADRRQSTAATFDRLRAPPFVKQRFRQPAVIRPPGNRRRQG